MDRGRGETMRNRRAAAHVGIDQNEFFAGIHSIPPSQFRLGVIPREGGNSRGVCSIPEPYRGRWSRFGRLVAAWPKVHYRAYSRPPASACMQTEADQLTAMIAQANQSQQNVLSLLR